MYTRSQSHGAGDILQFMREICKTDVAEQVYTAALNAVQALFTPDRGFVAVSEAGSTEAGARLPNTGYLSDAVVPIYAGGKLAAQLWLHFDEACEFSDYDVALIEIVAALSGFAIEGIQERDRLRRKQQAKDELVAVAAHELRSPLTAIIGASFLLRAGLDNERVRALDMIERNARVQVNLIEELLNACQLDAGKVKLRIEALDLGPVLDKVIEEIQPIATVHNTRLLPSFPRPLPVRGDAQRLWQVFWNLLINSVRFASPDGEVQITAVLDSVNAKVCIRDNGIGMNQEQLNHVFERFRQAHAPQFKTYAGMGLGLAIARDLVTMHGGTIAAESDGRGKGACFTVTLPGAGLEDS